MALTVQKRCRGFEKDGAARRRAPRGTGKSAFEKPKPILVNYNLRMAMCFQIGWLRRVGYQLAVAAILATRIASAADSTSAALGLRFAQTVRPFLATYCFACHGGPNPAAQLDLRQYSTVADVVRDHLRWALVSEKLTSMEMPPKGMKQPPETEREQIVQWIEAFRRTEAHKNAGDPGLVLVRRLSNSEYNYSVRDLTGIDLRPAREFPVDPSNSAGFDNSGESLSMSPALLNKYLQAAREISTHLVLGPAGFAFAPYPMLAETDREKYTIQRIVDFYDRQRSSISTIASPPITPITSRLHGVSNTAPVWASQTPLWPTLPPKPRSAQSICRRSGKFSKSRRKKLAP